MGHQRQHECEHSARRTGTSYASSRGVDAPSGIVAEPAHVSDVRDTVATMVHTARRVGHLEMTLGLALLAGELRS